MKSHIFICAYKYNKYLAEIKKHLKRILFGFLFSKMKPQNVIYLTSKDYIAFDPRNKKTKKKLNKFSEIHNLYFFHFWPSL